MQVFYSSHVQEVSVRQASATDAPHSLDLERPQYLHQEQKQRWATSAAAPGAPGAPQTLPSSFLAAGGAGFSSSLTLPWQALPDTMHQGDVFEEIQEEDWADEEGWTDTHIYSGDAGRGGGGRGRRVGRGRIRRHGKGSGRGGKHKRE